MTSQETQDMVDAIKQAFYEMLSSDFFEQRVRKIVEDVVFGEEGRKKIKAIVWETLHEHDTEVLEPALNHLYERTISDVDKQLEPIKQQLKGVEMRLEKLEISMANLESRMDKLEQHMTLVEFEVRSIKGEFYTSYLSSGKLPN